MSLRSSLLVSFLASASLASPLAADRLLVAGNDGFVMQTHTGFDALAYFTCTCNGPIEALAATGEHLYVLDQFGTIVVFDVASGALQNFLFPVVGEMTALAADGENLFVGTEEGNIVRLDATTGAPLGKRSVPAAVRTLLVHDGFLLAAVADGGVYRAPVAGGDFAYFTCFCFFEIQGMAVANGDLFIVDSFGTVGRADLETGALVAAFSVGPTNSIAASGGELFFYYEDGGVITRFDAETGTPLEGGITAPIDVQTMLAVPDAPGRRVQRANPPRSL